MRKVYRLQARSKRYKGVILNIVVIRLENEAGKASINILFSDDLTLDATTLQNYYSLRFQIEFDFRDAKQYFGLSDFKNYKEKNMTNFVNLSFTTTLIVKKILADVRKEAGKEKFGVLDLKLLFHSRFQLENLLIQLQKDPNLIYNSELMQKITIKGYINAA